MGIVGSEVGFRSKRMQSYTLFINITNFFFCFFYILPLPDKVEEGRRIPESLNNVKNMISLTEKVGGMNF